MTQDASYLDEIRAQIFEEARTEAAFDGWSARLIDMAADNLEIDKGKARLAFPKGVEDLLSYGSHKADAQMLARLAEFDLAQMKIREKVTLAVRLRLEVLLEDKESASRAVHALALPHHAPLATRLVYDTVDAIWRGIGDNSTDFNFYSKRAILAGVYSSTMMRMFSDTSEDHADTWAFLDRRIENVMQIEKAKARARKVTDNIPSPWKVLAGLRYPGGARR